MITWNQDNSGGTGFTAYLKTPYSFEETVARLLALSQQDAQHQGDEYKSSVDFIGQFNGKTFTLYDYKCDRQIHIGTGGWNLSPEKTSFNIEAFTSELINQLSQVEPMPFTATEHYDGTTNYSWP